MRDFVILYINGQRHEIRGSRAFSTLSDFLRYDIRLTGTKVVCAEGDCGSCTNFIGRKKSGKLEYRTVCSCIQFLFQLDGCHIVTVEGLQHDGKMNPVQEAMVRCQGSQCGFCTPGFIVSMCALFESQEVMTEQRLRRGLTGNLCRCTGYEPILRAGLEADRSKMLRLEQLYPSDQFQFAGDAILIQDNGKTFFKPTTVADAVKFKSEHTDCLVISGGTDLGVQVNKGMRKLVTVMSTAGLEPLGRLSIEANQISAGASVSLTELEDAAAKALPEYAQMLEYFGSPPIRNAGTLGGNIANGSPIGDTMPALFVLNAEVELTGVNGSRRVNMNDFYVGYRKTVAGPDELITRVFIPLPAKNEIFKLYKISKRKDLDISAFTAAIWMRLDGQKIADVRIAYGGVGPVIIRLKQTEALLKGCLLAEELFDEAGELAASETRPISDVRGSADFRLRLGPNILRKFYSELSSRSDASGNGHNGKAKDVSRR